MCSDLAIIMRKKLGDWSRVLSLLRGVPGAQTSTQFSDAQLDEAYSELGDALADRHQWRNALSYFLLGHSTERVLLANFTLEDFKYLQEMVPQLPDNHKLLPVPYTSYSGPLPTSIRYSSFF